LQTVDKKFMLVTFYGRVIDVDFFLISNMLALSFKLLELFIVYVKRNSRSHNFFFDILQELVIDKI
jgi:hypothetical protein